MGNTCPQCIAQAPARCIQRHVAFRGLRKTGAPARVDCRPNHICSRKYPGPAPCCRRLRSSIRPRCYRFRRPRIRLFRPRHCSSPEASREPEPPARRRLVKPPATKSMTMLFSFLPFRCGFGSRILRPAKLKIKIFLDIGNFLRANTFLNWPLSDINFCTFGGPT